MRAPDILDLAWVGLRRNKLRSGLTAVGVTVGVFALTTIVALGRGMEAAMVSQLTKDQDQTQLVVRPGFGPQPDGVAPVVTGVDDPAKADRLRKAISKRRRGGPGRVRRTRLTVEALQAIRARKHVVGVRPLAIDRFKVTLGDHTQEGALSFGIPGGNARWNRRVIAGQPFTKGARGVWLHEYLLYTWGYRTDAAQAALVGRTVTLSRPREGGGVSARALIAAARAQGIDVPVDPDQAERMLQMFGGRPGARGEAKELSLQLPILGVVRERIESDGFELWEDSFTMQTDLFLPQGLAEELFLAAPSNAARGYTAAEVEVDSPAQVQPLEAALKKEGYGTVSVGTILERIGTAMAIITGVVSGLTAIALVVAALGIVNTMIMNVSERTREIGVLKAVGATDREVRSLFLVESALIGLAGGGLGVLLAYLIHFPGDAANRFLIHRMTQYSFPGTIFSYPAWLIAVALGFAVVLSVVAALGPAIRASRVDPVEALRDE